MKRRSQLETYRPHTVFSLTAWSGVCMCKQPFTPPFSATDQPGAPLYLGTTYNLIANLVAQSSVKSEWTAVETTSTRTQSGLGGSPPSARP
jgi:hypothetical protein